MGAYVSYDRHIHIAKETKAIWPLSWLGYRDIDDEKLKEIVDNKKICTVQISEYLPDEAYQIIDQILALRPDITFRLFDFITEDKIDISFLGDIPHIKKLAINIYLRGKQENTNLEMLKTLKLKELTLDCFDLRDYSFVQELSDELESLTIMADTSGPGVNYDCKWLMRYNKLNTLWLGKKAKKNLKCISEMSSIRSLSLRGIKLSDFSFLPQMNLDKLALLWNSNSDLHELSKLEHLREIELWRINKLSDVSFIKDLTELEVIRLQDLHHVSGMPDLSNHKNLQRVFLIGTGIDINTLPKSLQEKVSYRDDRI